MEISLLGHGGDRTFFYTLQYLAGEPMRKWNKCRKCGCFLDPGEGSICDECRRAQEKVKIVPVIQEHGGQYRLFLRPDKKE